MEWYDKFKNQCRACKKYLAIELVKETQNFSYFKCRFCGFERKHERAWGIYKHKDGKSFLKRPGWSKFREVEVMEVKGGIQVLEVY